MAAEDALATHSDGAGVLAALWRSGKAGSAGCSSRRGERLIDVARTARRHEALAGRALRRRRGGSIAGRLSDEVFPDERLELLFVCAHPAIDAAVRTPLCSRRSSASTRRAIASAFVRQAVNDGPAPLARQDEDPRRAHRVRGAGASQPARAPRHRARDDLRDLRHADGTTSPARTRAAEGSQTRRSRWAGCSSRSCRRSPRRSACSR